MSDISSKFRPNIQDKIISLKLLEYEGTPEAIEYFNQKCSQLSDYGYWFLLSTLWVSYTGFSDLNLWKELFSSDRPGREKSIMKLSEIRKYKQLPYFVTVYRAHRENEKDWIAYTLDKDIAFRFAKERSVTGISEYKVKRKDILALFLRRGEEEVIILDKNKIQLIKTYERAINND